MSPDERRALRREMANHQGQWVVIRGSSVVGSAPTLDLLSQRVDIQPGDRRVPVKARHSEPYLRR